MAAFGRDFVLRCLFHDLAGALCVDSFDFEAFRTIISLIITTRYKIISPLATLLGCWLITPAANIQYASRCRAYTSLFRFHYRCFRFRHYYFWRHFLFLSLLCCYAIAILFTTPAARHYDGVKFICAQCCRQYSFHNDAAYYFIFGIRHDIFYSATAYVCYTSATTPYPKFLRYLGVKIFLPATTGRL